ncbi:lipoprotein-anchoring transpeptidase ErfK/SrfK [Cereibacter ovatus]|uniref:Lipoprotein-anchoring transpeptidase ErfK/SrfK n=1 Tax=Cereibacter ovatus TaxID=439529 RepID=A0A285CUP6_9RHOB|nr:L,D-transpeptidase [Cereibacter ovatus]SNX71291.1 lipoprotein-anchoring transpeptidase ErfK/SrfK [Cereibacter ovatus]
MIRIGRNFAVAAVVTGLLGACVPENAVVNGKVEEPAPKLQLMQGVYGARPDGAFTVPAVPVEKVPLDYQRQTVAYTSNEPPGTIIINPQARVLYFITGKNTAIRYGIAVGKAGFEWSGTAVVANRRPWPTWTPPKEMIERKPELVKWEKGQPGGPTNPLGARALYLETNGRDYGYRIHGTPEWQSIGRSASSGCIRMINQDVIDLYERVPDGAKVIVMTRDGKMPTGLTLPPPAPKKAKPVTVAAPAAAAVVVPSGLSNLPMLSPYGAPPAPATSTDTSETPAPVVLPEPDAPAPESPAAAPTAEAPAPTPPAAAGAPILLPPAEESAPPATSSL